MGTKRVGWARIKSLINENTNQMKLQKEQLVHVNNTATTLTESQSGATIFWTHGSNHAITLPDAYPGMNFKFIIVAGSSHTNDIDASTYDAANGGFYGKVTVTKSEEHDQYPSTQTLAKGAAVNSIHCHTATTTLGGTAGDVIDIVCLNRGYWTVNASLSCTGTPINTAVLAD